MIRIVFKIQNNQLEGKSNFSKHHLNNFYSVTRFELDPIAIDFSKRPRYIRNIVATLDIFITPIGRLSRS